MKVLVVPTWYPSGEDKLMGIYHKEFTCALNKYGIDADMLYIDRQRLSKPFKYLFMKKRVVEQEENYKVYKTKMLNLRPIGFDIQMSSYVRVFKSALKRYIKENGKPDIIHAMVSVPAGYAACVASREFDIPVLVTEHGGNLERLYKDEPYKKYGEYVLKNATLSTVSGYMKDIALKYTDYCSVIPNQVNTELFKNDKIRTIDGTFELISVCALREGKNLDDAFKAIKILIDAGMDIHYTILGDGFLEDFYKDACDKVGVSEHVSFLGRKTKTEIAKYLEESHALIISSELESFAIPGVEALASGIPVITTDCLGPVEFVDEKCGEIAKVRNPEDIARAIKKVYDNYQKYDRRHMREVADRYSEASVICLAKTEYDRILAKK